MSTHKELIETGKYVGKYKNTMRDYYTYGFKNMDSFTQALSVDSQGRKEVRSRQTISEDWDRLNNILSDYMEWSDDKKKTMCASLVNSQDMEVNPFHRLYRFALYNPNDPVYFLHTISALSDVLKLREEVSLPEPDEKKNMMTSSELLERGYYPSNIVSNEKGKNRTNQLNRRLTEMADMGFLKCTQKNGRGAMRHWSLSQMTMGRLVEEGSKVDADFEQHLYAALQFFSQYFCLGELGTFLQDRISVGKAGTGIRFKHDYFIQALNDYNFIDLLYAIEQKMWCKIKYRRELAVLETELLCFPMEIRVSSSNGREGLIYYEPFRRCFSSLRLDFIESIEFYTLDQIKPVVELSEEEIQCDIENAGKLSSYIWGTSPSVKQEKNAISFYELPEVRFRIAYDEKTYKRLEKERRIGKIQVIALGGKKYIDFFAKVADPGELKPWLRSLYSEIIYCDGAVDIESDVRNIAEHLKCESVASSKFSGADVPKSIWKLVKDPGHGEQAKAHEKLFHECFSVYFYIICDVFLGLCSDLSVYYTVDNFDKIITSLRQASIDKFKSLKGHKTSIELSKEQIKKILIDCDFVREGTMSLQKKDSVFKTMVDQKVYIPKYQLCKKVSSFYRDIVPLTVLEMKWLQTIISDQKIEYFLSDEEVLAVKNALEMFAPEPTKVTAFPVDKIIYFDRYQSSDNGNIQHFKEILTAIRRERSLRIKCTDVSAADQGGLYEPIYVEYSKREDEFKGYFRSAGTRDGIVSFFLNEIEKVEIVEHEAFDHEDALQALKNDQKNALKDVELSFYNVRNITDRILTEFSPWKKSCSFDRNSGLYNLKILYYSQDEEEIINRLIGYSPDIYFTDSEHEICVEIKKRVQNQLQLMETGKIHTDNIMDRESFEHSLKKPFEFWGSMDRTEVKIRLGEDVAAMVAFDQKNPHHCYDLFTHSILTAEALPDNAPVLLRVAAFFHDIGKPYVVTEKQGRQVYYNHAKKSAEIVMPILKAMGYADDEINEIVFYIKQHDMFLGWVLETDVYDPYNHYQTVINEPNIRAVMEKTEKKYAIFNDTIKAELWGNLLSLCSADASAQAELVYQNGILVDTKQHKLKKQEHIRKIVMEMIEV